MTLQRKPKDSKTLLFSMENVDSYPLIWILETDRTPKIRPDHVTCVENEGDAIRFYGSWAWPYSPSIIQIVRLHCTLQMEPVNEIFGDSMAPNSCCPTLLQQSCIGRTCGSIPCSTWELQTQQKNSWISCQKPVEIKRDCIYLHQKSEMF